MLRKKESIILAAIELIMEGGFSELTTAKLAARANTAETVIYRHFRNKQDIITQIIDYFIHELEQEFNYITAMPTGAIVKLERLLETHLAFIERTNGISRNAFSEQTHLGDEAVKSLAKNYTERYKALCISVLKDGIDEGAFRADLDLEMAAQSYIGLIYFVLHRWSLDGFSWRLVDESERILKYWLQVWGTTHQPVKQLIQ